MCHCEEEKQVHHLQKYSFLTTATSDCLGNTSKQFNDKLFLRYYETFSVKCGLYNALLYIKSNFYCMALLVLYKGLLSLSGDKAVTKDENVSSFSLLQHSIPRHETAFHRRLVQQTESPFKEPPTELKFNKLHSS